MEPTALSNDYLRRVQWAVLVMLSPNRSTAKVLALVLLSAFSALGQTHPFSNARPIPRKALVIGNQRYARSPLINPVNDAQDVARALVDAGFSNENIHLVLNADRATLRQAVRDFVEAVQPGDLALIYYSGHGAEVKGANYLIPVDFQTQATDSYIEDESVSAQRIMSRLEERGARVRVLILDACRSNPFAAQRAASGGLAPMEGKGALIVFATEAGKVAGDNVSGRNGVFTLFLLAGLRERGVSLDEAMKHVSRNVARATKEAQVPAIYGLLLEDVVLIPATVNPTITASSNQQLEALFGTGIGRFRFGMSPAEVGQFLPRQYALTAWEKLPIASEYDSVEVRYFWVPLSLFGVAGDSELANLWPWSPCWGGRSYITFLFSNQKLFRISARLNSDCQNRLALLRNLASSVGVSEFDAIGPAAFRRRLKQTTVTGYIGPAVTFEVFSNDTPEPDAQWVRTGTKPHTVN